MCVCVVSTVNCCCIIVCYGYVVCVMCVCVLLIGCCVFVCYVLCSLLCAEFMNCWVYSVGVCWLWCVDECCVCDC